MKLRNLLGLIQRRRPTGRPSPRLGVEQLEQLMLPSAVSDAAFPLLAARLAEARGNFYVYRDADSGLNHGFPTGRAGAAAKVHVDAAAIDDPNSPTGTSSDPNRIDATRGTVLRVAFDALGSSEFAALRFEEPDGWGQSPSGTGYDLRGATSLLVDVRTPTPAGLAVQFGVGSGLTSVMHLNMSSSYTTLRIPLTSISPAPNLAEEHVLFSVRVNGAQSPNGGTLLLDNIRFDPAPTAQAEALSLPTSTQTFGVVPASGTGAVSADQMLRNVATTSEAALTLLALLQRHTADDLVAARRLADALVYALRNDNSGRPVPGASPGLPAGLHDAYSNGDLPLASDARAPRVGAKGEVRLATYSTGSGLNFVMDGASARPNAYAILGLVEAYRRFNDTRYRDAARDIGRWVFFNLADPEPGGIGGYFQGYATGGNGTLLRAKWTADNALLFRAFTVLIHTEPGGDPMPGSSIFVPAAELAGRFLQNMFDTAAGRFWAGTVPVGTAAAPGIDPTGPQFGDEVANVFDVLDANTLTTLALTASPTFRTSIDWRRPMQYALDNFAREIQVGDHYYSGFSLVREPVSGPDGIAWEVSAQMVVALRTVDKLYGESRFEDRARKYFVALADAQQLAPFGDSRGLVAATVVGDNLPPSQQGLATPFGFLPARVALGATTWTIAADQNVNLIASAGRLRLGATSYSVSEADGVVRITVLREDGSAGPATVHYATSDGTARANVNYIPTEGTLSFADGQASATITIPILNDGQLKGDLTFSVTIGAPVTGATLGSPTAAIVTIRDATSGATANQRYVARLYQDLLGRQVDSGGLAYWSGLLDRGFPRAQFAQVLLSSPEFLERTVRGLYRHHLQREADDAGLRALVAYLQRGGTIEQAASLLIASGEYAQKRGGGTVDGFIDALYIDVLHRSADAGGRAWLTSMLNAGVTRDKVAMILMSSDEFRTHLIDNPNGDLGPERQTGLIHGYYQYFLRRNADPAGLSALLGLFRRGATQQQVMVIFAASDEYYNRP